MKSNPWSHQVEDALRSERPQARVSPGFAERVIEALPSRPLSAQAQALPLAPARPVWMRLLLATSLASVAFLLWFQFSPVPVSTPSIAQARPSAVPPALNLPPVNSQQVQALAAKLDQPLEKELQRVLSDTRNAIRFVASNFTPDP